jgi:hypothetical protein
MSIQNVRQRLPQQFLDSLGKQLKLPVGFGKDGSMVSLEEVLSSGKEAKLWPELPPTQQAEITARRIELQPKFNMAFIGGGIVGKEQAIQEVKVKSDIGRRLIEIENLLLTKLIAEIEEKQAKNDDHV